MMRSDRNQTELRGFITELHFAEAEREFPGITRFYLSCACKPRTFLDLLAAYVRAQKPCPR